MMVGFVMGCPRVFGGAFRWMLSRNFGLVCLLLSAPLVADSNSPFLAMVVLDEALSTSPDDAEILARRARLYRRHGFLEQARADLERCDLLIGPAPSLALEWTLLLRDFGELDSAVSRIESFLSHRPGHIGARRLHAELLSDLGKYRSAGEQYSILIAQQDHPTPEVFLARAETQKAAGLSAEFVLGLTEAIERLGPMTAFLERLYRFERERGEVASALRWLDRLSKETPRTTDWQIEKGRYLFELGRFAEAQSLLRSVLEELSTRGRRLRVHQRLLGEVTRLLSDVSG